MRNLKKTQWTMTIYTDTLIMGRKLLLKAEKAAVVKIPVLRTKVATVPTVTTSLKGGLV